MILQMNWYTGGGLEYFGFSIFDRRCKKIKLKKKLLINNSLWMIINKLFTKIESWFSFSFVEMIRKVNYVFFFGGSLILIWYDACLIHLLYRVYFSLLHVGIFFLKLNVLGFFSTFHHSFYPFLGSQFLQKPLSNLI